MKNSIPVLVFLVCCLACKQKDTTSNNEEVFNSKYVRLIPDTNRMMLIENVVIHYGDLYAEADSVLLERPRQLVTVFGIKKARFKEKDIRSDEHKGMIRYKKGDTRFSTE